METDKAKQIISEAEVKARMIISQAEVRASDISQNSHKAMMRDVKETISETIRIVVNGKIDRIDGKFDDYVKDDMKWKKEYEPYIKGLVNVSGGAKILIWCAVGISAVIAAFVAVKKALI